MIRNDVPPHKIKDLFPYITEDIPENLIKIIKQVKLTRPIIPETIKWLGRLAGFSASNNWAIEPEKTASGKAMLCGDPHFDVTTAFHILSCTDEVPGLLTCWGPLCREFPPLCWAAPPILPGR